MTATFSAEDPGAQYSGVAKTEYKVDSAADWTTYSPASPPQVGGVGQHTIQYRSTDGAGNVEDPKSVTFTIASPPSGGQQQPPPGGRAGAA